MSEPVLPPTLAALVDDLSSPGPAQQLGPGEAERLVERALRDAESPAVARFPRVLAWSVAATALLVGGGAAAAWVKGAFVSERPAPQEITKPTKPQKTEPAAPPERRAAPALQTAPGRAESGAGEAPRQNPPASEAPAPRRANRETARPQDLLERANRLRGDGRLREAEQVYLRVAQLHPGTGAAYVASVAAAQLEVASRPASAIRLFETARRQRPGGPLDREIRQGLAQAFRRTGNAEGERHELEGLVRRYPGTPTARAAQQRLSEL